MSNNLTIETENIGGLLGKNTFHFKKGINTVKAPNALGKTSLLHAIELLGIRKQDLSGKGYYGNLFTDDAITVKTTGSIDTERRFTVSGESLQLAEGNPIIKTDKDNISSICFVTPENPLIEMLLSGKSIKSHIESVSDSKYYETLVSILKEKHQTTKTKLSLYKETTTKIDSLKDTIKTLTKEKSVLEKKLKGMPALDGEKLFSDVGKANKKRGEEEQLSKQISTLKTEINDVEGYIETMEIRKKELEQILKDENRIKEVTEKIPKILTTIENKENERAEIIRKISIAKQKQAMIDKNMSNLDKYHQYGESSCFACGNKLSKDKLGKWKESILRNVSDLEKSKMNLETTIEEMEHTLDSLEEEKGEIVAAEIEHKGKIDSIKRHFTTINSIKDKLEKATKEQETVVAQIADLSKNESEYEKYQERRQVEINLEEKESMIKSMTDRIEQLKKDVMDVPKLQRKVDFLADMKQYIAQRKEHILDGVRIKYNDMINQVYNDMGFKNIEQIVIQPDYTIKVIKKKKGFREVTDFPLKALSASERITLGVVLLIVTKRECLPEFPFFVVDEVVTSYDPSRFEKIKQYLKNVADYVLITELTAKGTEVDIIHET